MNKETGNLSKRFFLIFSISTSVLLGIGFGIIGLWFINFIILILLTILLIAVKLNWVWVFSAYLITSTLIATVGLFLGAPIFLIILGVSSALASWELSNTNRKYNEVFSHPFSHAFETNRLIWLGISLGSGLLIAGLSQFIQIELPFWVIYLITIIILLCFYQIFRILNQSNQ